MAEYTDNLNLKKPSPGEDALIEDINNNMGLIDAFAGNVNGKFAYTTMTSGTDFNNLTSKANYLVGNITQMSHYPTECGSSGFLYVDNYSTYIKQEFHGNLGSAHRFSYDGGQTWVEWVNYSAVRWIGSNTVSNIQSALVSLGASLPDGSVKDIEFGISTASGNFAATNYIGELLRISVSRLMVNIRQCMYDNVEIIGNYKDGTWHWDKVTTDTQISSFFTLGKSWLNNQDVNLLDATGIYYIGSDPTIGGVSASYLSYSTCITFAATTGMVSQFFTGADGRSFYIRQYRNNAWQSVVEYAQRSMIYKTESLYQGNTAHTLTFDGKATTRNIAGFIIVCGQSALAETIPFAFMGTGINTVSDISSVSIGTNSIGVTVSGKVISFPASINGGWGTIEVMLLRDEPQMTMTFA